MNSQSDGWLTLREASLQLGISELTIRRRIKSRKIAFRLTDGKYYVNPALEVPAVERGAEDNDTEQQNDEQARPVSTGEASSFLLSKLATLAEGAGRASVLEERVASLEADNRALRETALALSNRNGWLESKLEERESEIKLLTDDTPRRSWLRRLFSPGP